MKRQEEGLVGIKLATVMTNTSGFPQPIHHQFNDCSE